MNPGLILELSFIGKFLMLEHGEQLSEQEKSQWIDFIMRLQQLTGPLMAKGFEDTTLYIYNRFLSLNEVGGDPSQFGTGVDAFHRFNLRRGRSWPHSLNATSTHDTKRGEDVRARLNVLSEIPDEWERYVFNWGEANRRHKRLVKGREVPDRNDEYFLYQSLVGGLPLAKEEHAAFVDRVKNYMIKAVREAKVHTGWLKPDTDYEDAFTAFIENILEPAEDNSFVGELREWTRKIARFGALNSLSQVLLKLTCPGAPDLYQGTELWDLHFVDPDNRQPVDFERRRRFLAEIRKREKESLKGLLADVLTGWEDGRVKLFLTHKALNFRQRHKELFQSGSYIPLVISGAAANRVCAFARRKGTDWTVVAVPRFPTALFPAGNVPLGGQGAWENTMLELPDNSPHAWKSVFTGETLLGTETTDGKKGLYLKHLFLDFPVALLERSSIAPTDTAASLPLEERLP
jgi:(1->4)-alpha-D-glucan 1-alpha-D-glucosylmutase